MKYLPLVSLLITMHYCNAIKCEWDHNYLCGDKCLPLTHICYCGNVTLTIGDTRYVSCCNDDPCIQDSNDNVICNGTPQSSSLPCNGVCKQDAEHGWITLPCDNQYQCYLKVYSCLGRSLCDE